MSFSCIMNIKIPCYITHLTSLPHILILIFLMYYYFKILHFTCISVTYFILSDSIFFTSDTISTSYTDIHYTVFDEFNDHKKSSFLVIGVLFDLLDAISAFLCTSSAFSLIKSIMTSSMEAAVGILSILH